MGDTPKSSTMSLADWLEATGTSYRAFSEMLPCSRRYPRMLAKGLATPSYKLAVRIEQVTGGAVPRSTWYPPEDPNRPVVIETRAELDYE